MRGVTRAVGYVRVSKVRGSAGDSFLSPDLQREQIAAAAGREGLEVVEMLEQRISLGATGAARSGTRRSGARRTARSEPSLSGTCPGSAGRTWTPGSRTKLRGILGPDRYADATADRVAVVNKADMEDARERHGGRYELVARLWLQEWGWAERKEYVSRMIKSVVVSKGREPLSERVAIELR